MSAPPKGLGHEALKAVARKSKSNDYNNRCHLGVAARSQDKAESAVRTIASDTGSDPADFTPVVLDLTSDETIDAAAELVRARFGRLDVLVNNAGINRSPDPNATLRKDMRAVYDTNVFGVAVTNAAFLPLLRASKYPQRRIVTLTSGLGSFGVALTRTSPYNGWDYPVPTYGSSKSATNMPAARDCIKLEAENILTELVEPGYCRTAFGGFEGHKEADQGGAVIAHAAV
ncbi:short-chain dehydrogenase [Xylariomycetidae sp. FL2044]|nr:short-chain dehydrogenase [Xylariomycetidae sp. FL2044]